MNENWHTTRYSHDSLNKWDNFCLTRIKAKALSDDTANLLIMTQNPKFQNIKGEGKDLTILIPNTMRSSRRVKTIRKKYGSKLKQNYCLRNTVT